ncbi:MAG: nucleotidyltransferase domain-containing protein [bacterium]
MDFRLKDFVRGLKEGFGESLSGVILYGSRARGEAVASSDYDVFILIDGSLPKSPFKRSKLIMSKIKDRKNINFILRTKAEFETSFPSLYLDLALDGKVLFDKKDYVKCKLERIKELLREAGLVREKRSYGFGWYWKKVPVKFPWKIDWEGVDAIF